jgi:hypothetical protein
MTSNIPKECRKAAKILEYADLFSTGQGILKDAAKEIERLESRLKWSSHNSNADKLIPFTEDSSLLINSKSNGFAVYRYGDRTQTIELDGVLFEGGKQIRVGLVHLLSTRGIYEVKEDNDTGFVVGVISQF